MPLVVGPFLARGSSLCSSLHQLVATWGPLVGMGFGGGVEGEGLSHTLHSCPRDSHAGSVQGGGVGHTASGQQGLQVGQPAPWVLGLGGGVGGGCLLLGPKGQDGVAPSRGRWPQVGPTSCTTQVLGLLALGRGGRPCRPPHAPAWGGCRAILLGWVQGGLHCLQGWAIPPCNGLVPPPQCPAPAPPPGQTQPPSGCRGIRCWPRSLALCPGAFPWVPGHGWVAGWPLALQVHPVPPGWQVVGCGGPLALPPPPSLCPACCGCARCPAHPGGGCGGWAILPASRRGPPALLFLPCWHLLSWAGCLGRGCKWVGGGWGHAGGGGFMRHFTRDFHLAISNV